MERVSKRLCVDLPQLQSMIKRDHQSYVEEFQLQYQHYTALLKLLLMDSSNESKPFQELVVFLSQVCHYYPQETNDFPNEIKLLLTEQFSVLHPDVRMALFKALTIMRNKDLITPENLLELCFVLFRCQDKLLRTALYSYIISDIKRINNKRKNNRVNNALQVFMYQMLNDTNSTAVKMSLDVMVELYRRNIWNDAKTVNVITLACFSPFHSVVVAALKFFLYHNLSSVGNSSDDDDDDSDDEDQFTRKIKSSKQNFKGKQKQHKIEKALKVLKKQKKRKISSFQGSFLPIHLVHDPQDFAEKLFKKLESCHEKFAVRVMIMNLISRLIGAHQLILLNFYSYLQKFLQPHQKDVTLLLSFLVHASHENVPPEPLEQAIRCVANNFIADRNTSEAIALGLNTVCNVCSKCPLAMTEELLQDLTQYKSYRNKAVVAGARSLINLFRTLNPSLLTKKDRGRPTATTDNEPSVEEDNSDEEQENHFMTFPEPNKSKTTKKKSSERHKYTKKPRAPSSTTNKEKKKSKFFVMMKQKKGVRDKKKRSFREKQAALRNSLLKRKKDSR